MLHYWFIVWAKAFWDSIHFIDKSGEGLCYDVLVLVLDGGLLWFTNKGEPMTLRKCFSVLGEGVGIGLAAFILVLFGHALWSPYQIQHETESNLISSRSGRDQAVQSKVSLEAIVAQREAKIDSLNDKLGTTFTQLAQSQGVINNLGTQVVKFRQPEPMNVSMLNMGSLKPDIKKGEHTISWLILNNKTITPIRADFVCENNIADLDVGIVGSGTMLGGAGRTFKNGFKIEIQSPAWSPISPMLVTLYFNEDDVGTCQTRLPSPSK